MLGYIISALLGVAVYGIFQTIRGNSAAALLGNLMLKNKLNKNDQQIAQDQGLEQAEQQKRDAIQEALDGKIRSSQEDRLTDLKDFFNNEDKNN